MYGQAGEDLYAEVRLLSDFTYSPTVKMLPTPGGATLHSRNTRVYRNQVPVNL